MRHTEILMIFFALAFFFGSCGMNKGGKQLEFEEQEFENPYRDSTIYGLCGEGSAMNTLQIITDNGDTLVLSTLKAREKNSVFGNYAMGDRMAVVANVDSTEALIVINLSTLMGKWVMPNPIDGSDETGFTLFDGGIAESVQMTFATYTAWRILNGMLELTTIDEGGGDIEENNTFRIVSLTPDSLTLTDEEEFYEYARKLPEVEYSDIELEESAFEDFKM